MVKSELYTSTEAGPRIVGFVCNWNALSAVDMAGVNRREYPASVRLVKLLCLGRLHLGLILKAFELGADGILLLGCPERECQHGDGMGKAKELLRQARKILHLLGIDQRRLALVEVPLGRDDILARRVSAFVKYLSGATQTMAREGMANLAD